MLRAAVLALTLAGCASAEKPGVGGGDDDSTPIDAAIPIDTVAIDAMPQMITLSQSTDSMTITPAGSVACANGLGFTAENSWYRVFRLADASITGGLVVNSVAFGILSASGTPQIEIKLGTYSGPLTPIPDQLDTALITPLTSMMYTAPNTLQAAAHIETVAITTNVPALSQLIVEIHAPDLTATSKSFFLGGNEAGETRPSYMKAPGAGCAIAQPRSSDALGFANASNVIIVNGTTSP